MIEQNKIRHHADLCCKQHPDLRWNTKIQAVSGRKYNGERHIFYRSFHDVTDADGVTVSTYRQECDCPVSDLYVVSELSHEDAEVCAELLGGVYTEDELVPGRWYVSVERGAYRWDMPTYHQVNCALDDAAWKEKSRSADLAHRATYGRS